MSRPSRSLADLALSRADLDRAAVRRADPALIQRCLSDRSTQVLVLREGYAWTEEARLGDQGAPGAAGPVALRLRGPQERDADALLLFLGLDRGGTAYLAAVQQSEAAPDPEPDLDLGRPGWHTLREVGLVLGDRDTGMFTSALALANWHATHTHCPRCGAPTEVVSAGWVRRCPREGSEHYPRTDPAVIMAVTDEQDRLLLARNPAWAPGRRSILAGFVEPGESLQAAVARETAEEVGIGLRDIEYRGDQPWPFPASLMLGFTARATSTDLVLDPVEIAEAEFVSRDQLRVEVEDGRFGVAGRLSIARRLIELWYGGPLSPPTELVDMRRA